MTDVMSIFGVVACVIIASNGGCAWHDDGSHVSVALVHRTAATSSPAAAGEPRTFVTQEEDIVTIARVVFTLESGGARTVEVSLRDADDAVLDRVAASLVHDPAATPARHHRGGPTSSCS